MVFFLSLFLLLLNINRQYFGGKLFACVEFFNQQCWHSVMQVWNQRLCPFWYGETLALVSIKNLLKVEGSSFISFTEESMFHYKTSLETGECCLWRGKIIRFGIARAFCLGGSGPAAHSLLKNGDIYQSIKGQSSKVNNSPKQGHLAPIN